MGDKIKTASRYYSQHGEDFLLNEIFKDKESGFFVEVGCIDGRRFSNTLTFEERGWTGLCIEAHEGYIDLLRKNRPNSIICHCAAAERDEDNVMFYANARGTLSTLDKSQEERFKRDFRDYFSGFQEQTVNKRRLDTIFEEHGIKQIDILSLDVEGYEIEALQGIDFNKYKPKVFVIESDSPEHESELDRILMPNGYFKSVKLGSNIFYLIDSKLDSKLKGKTFSVELSHTNHPLDKEGNSYRKVQINTGMSIYKRFISKLRSFSKSN